MRKILVMALAAWFSLGVVPANADVNVRVDINKTKDKKVVERIAKLKLVLIVAVAVQITDKAAESETLINQTNSGNVEVLAIKTDSMTGSVLFNSGITGVNQASGNMNNQANAVSVAIDPNFDRDHGTRIPFFLGGFAESQAAADQRNKFNTLVLGSSSSSMSNSVSGNSGITGVNQASGSMNNQANGVSVAVALRPGIALSETDLGQVNAYNTVIFAFSTATMSNSVQGNSGITGVNQSSGSMNNQANLVSVAATTGSASLSSP
ncbi:MAG: hypothetical protein V3S25_00230 [Nitrospirales bacterium]